MKTERREWDKTTYVTRRFNSSTHDNNLFDLQERLWILGSRNGKVRQRANCYNRNCIRLILSQQVEHYFMRRLQRGLE